MRNSDYDRPCVRFPIGPTIGHNKERVRVGLMLQEALIGGIAFDKLRRALRTFGAIFNSKEFEKLIAGTDLIEQLQKELHNAQAALEENGFPYYRQFEPIKRERLRQPPQSTRVAVRWAGPSRSIYNPSLWETNEEITKSLLPDYFDREGFDAIPGAKEAEAEWVSLFGDRSVVWKAKDPQTVVTVANHPYLKMMYPFIAAGYTPKASLSGGADPRMHIVNIFLSWLSRLCGKNLKSQFSVERIFVSSRHAYVSGKFLFEGIMASTPAAGRLSSYMLDRRMLVGEARDNIFVVATGVPMSDFGDTSYLTHVETFLNQFQLVDEALPSA
jgi:hypothetical protein